MIDFEGAYDYSNSQFAQMFTYYAMIDRLFHLEYFMGKMSSNLLDVLKMESCVFVGLPFWGAESDTEATVKTQRSSNQEEKDQPLSERILQKIVTEKRSKVNLADDVLNIAAHLSLIIKKL